MNVIRHQYIGVQLAAGVAQPVAKSGEVGAVVVIAEETGIPIVAALHDVQRRFGEMDSGSTRHKSKPSIG
ncbi:hypothetical protein [Nevskia sp.]|uniref:hypothetical protein n=1 Tax=Nevskia sp. TaxID=1929292 RepID=UPI0025DB380C|nr:hypothetical protein [Nevskia sp.]